MSGECDICSEHTLECKCNRAMPTQENTGNHAMPSPVGDEIDPAYWMPLPKPPEGI